MDNRVFFDVSTSKAYLSDILEQSLDHAVSSEPMEVNGVQIVLERVGESEIDPKGKQIDIRLPLKIDLKRSAGLFTVEGSGSINLHLRVDFDVSEKMRLKAKTDLVAHEWIEKPVLEIGALNIPIETLVNMVLKHHESIITAKIDQSIQQFSDLNALLQKGLNDARDKVKSLDLKGNTLSFDINSIALQQPQLNNGIVSLHGIISPDIAVNSKEITAKSASIPFSWLDEVPSGDTTIEVPMSVDYDFLEGEIKDRLQGMEVGGKFFELDMIDIRGDQGLTVKMQISEPIKAQVFVTGNPQYDASAGVLHLNNLDVKVNPANLIYKLTAPLVNRFVEGKMEDFFPLAINNQLSTLAAEKIPASIPLDNAQLSITQQGVEVSKLAFLEKELEVVVKVKNLKISSRFGS